MCTVSIKTEKVGTRVYVVGNTFAIKDRLKSAGCHWDGERKQWWIGAAKADKITSIVGGLDGKEIKEDFSNSRLYGKVEYKGRSYYVLAVGQDRLRLTVLDSSIVFWAAVSECKWTKRYEVRTRFGGYGRGQIEVYTTLGSIREFIETQKQEKASGKPACAECGKHGDLHHDLEDGAMKCYSCCDIPE
jgi:hypothetical protein